MHFVRTAICFLVGHNHQGIAHARWSWCNRCHRNIYTGGNRGR